MLVLDRVHKSFYDPGRGQVRAVDGVNCTLGDGVTALVGANGAGKSTLLRLIATLLVPDRGAVTLDGRDSRSQAQAIRTRLGYLSTTTRLYPRFTAQELLEYVGRLFSLDTPTLRQRIAAMVDSFGLGEFLHQRTSGLSTGQLQRLNLARTLLPDPDLLILDEPTTGLDLVAADQLVAAVRSAQRPGRLIIMATHIVREVEMLADRLLVLRQGVLVHDGPPAQLGQGESLAQAILDQVRGP